MNISDYALALSVGVMALAIAATAWGVVARREAGRQAAAALRRTAGLELEAAAAVGAVEASGSALISLSEGEVDLIAGSDALARAAVILGCPPGPQRVVEALTEASPEHGPRIAALITRGEAFSFSVRARGSSIAVAGGPAGGSAWLRMTPGHAAPAEISAPQALDRLEALDDILWIIDETGGLIWANRAWLTAVDAETLAQARERGLECDKSLDQLAREALASGKAHEAVRWVAAGGRRRAYRVIAAPTGEAEVMM
ncbi:MAG: hypothetical protein WCI21_05300, partial [Alphaproteobacteria bacterium]